MGGSFGHPAMIGSPLSSLGYARIAREGPPLTNGLIIKLR